MRDNKLFILEEGAEGSKCDRCYRNPATFYPMGGRVLQRRTAQDGPDAGQAAQNSAARRYPDLFFSDDAGLRCRLNEPIAQTYSPKYERQFCDDGGVMPFSRRYVTMLP